MYETLHATFLAAIGQTELGFSALSDLAERFPVAAHLNPVDYPLK